MTAPQDTYTIKAGDTLWSIAVGLLPKFATAAQINAKIADLQAWNPGIVPTALPVGLVIRVVPPDPLQAKLDAALAEIARLQAAVAGMQTSLAAAAAQHAADQATMTAQVAKIAELEAELHPTPPPPPKPPTAFGIDLSDITGDEKLSEAAKVGAHRALGLHLTGVRVFFGSGRINWKSERILALDPTKGDSIILSTLSRDIAGLTADLKNTPDEWRGHVDLCHGHEREADLLGSANPDAAVADWLAGCQEKADMLDGLGSYGYSSDHFGKIMLHFTQEHDTKHPSYMHTRDRFYGGQDFGWFGEDCYHNAAWLNQDGRYETPQELFDGILNFAASIKRPVRIPEWGATLAKGDTGGTGRAKAIADGGAYLKAHGVLSANWWCATGSKDATQPKGYRDFHLEQVSGATSPELKAYLAL